MTYTWRQPGGEILHAGLRVRMIPGEGSTVLLLHGLAGSGRYFGAAFDALADGACLVAPDLLGFGGSPRPQDVRYDAADHARAVRETLESLRVPRPILAVGHSAGALVALALAEEWPEGIGGVVAFGPPIYRTAQQARRRIARLSLYVRLFALDGPLARWSCHWMCSHPVAAKRLFRALRRDLPPEVAGDGTLHTWRSYSRTLRNLIIEGDTLARVGRMQVPLLLVAGEDDRAMDLALLREIARVCAGTQLEIWPGGHDLPLSSPERAIGAVRSLARLLRPARRAAPTGARAMHATRP